LNHSFFEEAKKHVGYTLLLVSMVQTQCSSKSALTA